MSLRAGLAVVMVFVAFAPMSRAQRLSPEMENYANQYRQIFSAPKYADYVAAHGEEDAETKSAIAGLVKQMNGQLVRDNQLGDPPEGDERIFLMTHLVHVLRFELAAHPRAATDEAAKKFVACSKRLHDSLNRRSFQGWNDDLQAGGSCMPLRDDAPTREASKAVVLYINALVANDERPSKGGAAGTGRVEPQLPAVR